MATIHYIGPEVSRAKTEEGSFNWKITASQDLARKISDLVKEGKVNIRIVQDGDSLGRIAEGLSQLKISLTNKEHHWNTVTVVYRGTTEQIQEQQKKNPSCKLINAELIYPGQLIYLKNLKTLIVAATLEDLKPEIEST